MRPRVFSSHPLFAVSAILVASTSLGWAQENLTSIPGRLHGSAAGKSGSGRFAAFASDAAPGLAAGLESNPPELSLGALEPEAEAVVRSPQLSAPRVGRVRGLADDAASKGAWATLADGRSVWRLALRSPEAVELRLHFRDFSVGEGSVWVYSGADEAPQRFSGKGIYNDGDFWTGTISSDRIVIEYMAASGLRSGEPVPFQIAEAGHLWEATSAAAVTQSVGTDVKLALAPQGRASAAAASAVFGSGGAQREIAGCHLDVACYPDFRQAATAVARILFAEAGGLYTCSGALVNTRSGVGTPLFMTADHCISNEAAARSVEASFFYQSESCGGGLKAVESVLGANYLVSESLTRGDYSMIRLLGLPKSQVQFLGITNEEPALNAPLTSIHHPAGSYKRITFGVRAADETVAVLDTAGVIASPADRYYQMLQREGRSEGGSSGSPLLNERKQIIGTLSSGPVFSAIPGEDEVLLCLSDEAIFQYGRLSKAWETLRPFIEDLRPAQMALPRTGDKFAANRVRFQWSPGVGVSEYRLQVGKTRGGSEYADLKVTGQEATVENLPEDGSPVYARLLSRLDDKWEVFDYSYLASSGGVTRAAALIAPAVGSVLEGSRVEFKWSEGTGVAEYLLYVGSTPGGVEYARRSMGKATSAIVTNLPGNGQRIFVRIHSRVAGGSWLHSDAIYQAATTQGGSFSLKITNQLAYPVTILVNERAVMSVRAGQYAEQVLPRQGEIVVQWQLVRPTHPASGIPLGVALADGFQPVTPAGELSYEIGTTAKGITYFTPFVTNQSGRTFFAEVNSGLATGAGAGAIENGTANLGLGYYPLAQQSNVRGYYGSYGYSGASVLVGKLVESVEPGTGIVRVDLSVPAPANQ